MVGSKRLILCTLLGLVFGVICWGMISTKDPSLGTPGALTVILSRAIMGFALGISRLPLRWWVHGTVLGALLSLPLAVSALGVAEMGMGIAFATLVLGAIYGLIIELVATLVFKAGPQQEG